MNFSEELAMAGELELTDSELETVYGGVMIPPVDIDPHPGGGGNPRHDYEGGGRWRGDDWGGGRWRGDDWGGGYWGEPDFGYSYPQIPFWLWLEYQERRRRRFY